MSRKKQTYQPRKFESINGSTYTDRHGRPRKETNASIYESMLVSNAFIDLKPRQKILYVVCKAQLYGKRKPGKDNKEVPELQEDNLFYFSWKMAQDYELYKAGSHSNFYADMRVLMEHGFIESVVQGSINNQKSIYRFSDKWQRWEAGTDYAPKKKPAKNTIKKTA